MGLIVDLFIVMDMGIFGRDIIFILGGFFLIYKSVKEIYEKMEYKDEELVLKVKKVIFKGIVM